MINPDRLAVVIGKNGKTKKMIERLTNTKLKIDSKTGQYEIIPLKNIDNKEDKDKNDDVIQGILNELNLNEIEINNEGFDQSFMVWLARNIIEAINIGFKPEKALLLLDQNYNLEIIDLVKIIGRSEKRLKRMIGRLIGEKGKVRESLEKFSRCYISIYPPNNLIGLIGDFESLKIARKAINMILQGVPHRTVLSFLHNKENERKKDEFLSNWKPVFD